MAENQFLDYVGLQHFWNKLKGIFVQKDGDKVLSDNNYTDEDKQKVDSIQDYTLTPATASSLGGIMVGSGLEIDTGGRLNTSLLEPEEIAGTTQNILFRANGDIDRIEHIRDGIILRTDVFNFDTDAITEVRTLANGKSLTIVTNTTTLVTTSTYSEV